MIVYTAACTGGRVPTDCAHHCEDTCQHYRIHTCEESELPCSPGCVCPVGMKLDEASGNCINETKCPCYDIDGTQVLPGFTFAPAIDCYTW